jgi:hypothetical protein
MKGQNLAVEQRWAVIGSCEEGDQELWLEQVRDCFPVGRGPRPGEDAHLSAQATYAVECLLDALLMKPEDRAELEGDPLPLCDITLLARVDGRCVRRSYEGRRRRPASVIPYGCRRGYGQ